MEETDNSNSNSDEKTSRKPSTGVVVQDFLSSATIHGLHKAAANESLIRRCVWIILLMGMITSLSIFTYLELSMYFRYETRTSTHVSKRKHVEFPAVTICNINQVKSSVVDCADLEFLMFHESELSHYAQLPIHRPNNGTSISGDDIDKCMRAHSHNLEIFRSCFWEGRQVNCSHIFDASITPMGMCFTFNGVLPQQKSRMYGSVGGLRVVIDIEQHLYFFPETLQSGIKKILLPPPHGNCVDQVSDANRLTRFHTYSSVACWTECFLNAVLSRCSCRHYYISGSERLCNHDELVDCYVAITDLHVDNLTELVTARNGCQTCPQVCTTYTYDWSLSYAAFGSQFVNERLVNASFFPNKSYISSNFIDLTLFYNSLSETVVEEVPAKMLNDIVGNVGGQMGMFLGASILSIVELIEFLCLLIAKQRSVSPTSTNQKYKEDNTKGTTPALSTITQENALHIQDA
ncbi:acid-sensing ion channel 5-like [Mizuhopecten yessoensis]|uniref:acid-sensing ion channel 5-like n=1 Tax=Mizuhopecten yessoensis TaxID=6573 RepID=UPI000B45DF3D|nr:acid-sensing ion channel 5-like [Mizuhopecten yessoensis]